MLKALRTLATLALTLLIMQPSLAAPSQEEQRLEELRNTVVNLLQALVQRGIITREQADQMVKQAEQKAAADMAAAAQKEKQQEKEEANAVRVPYVPQIVQDQIAKQVAQTVEPAVTKQVETEAKTEGWGVPAALPDWLNRVALSGDVRVRGEADIYPSGNAQGAYLNLNAINADGGISEAGAAAFLNTSVDRYYPVVRLRLNLNAILGGGWSIGARIGSGTLVNPDSLNQVMGQYGGRYTTDIDLAFIQWQGTTSDGRQQFRFLGGKYPNPFFYSDLVWMPDVTFEGFAGEYRLGIAPSPQVPHYWFVTVGAIPEQYVPLTEDYGAASNDKWLYAGQTGLDFETSAGSRLQFGVAYYDFNHMAGQKNTFESTLTNYTAPPYFQKGNTVFDISNTDTPTSGNLFALASEFHELDYMVAYTYEITPRYQFNSFLDYVKNLGYDARAVAERVGYYVPPRVQGYEGQIGFGSPLLDHFGAWDAFIGYRYLERDAVVDAFTDQDYHLGGTDAKGYIVGADASLTQRVWVRLRYMPFDPIDGPPLAIDVWQLDLNARF
jgi:hypothetical protein